MAADKPSSQADEEFWRDFLTAGHSKERAARGLFKLIPHAPRCRLCAAPFAGIGAPMMRVLGRAPSDQTPNLCAACFTFMSTHHGGAEIECTLLFADVRGSTTIAEGMSSGEFRALMDRFYTTASTTVFEHDGLVDKFVGDELVAMFIPLLTGSRHAAGAIQAAQALLRATGHADPGGPWLPLGAGVHTGMAWVGAVGTGSRTELTALGDAVNATARLASSAAAGEILVTSDAAGAAGLDPMLEQRSLQLKGKQEITQVVRLTVRP